MRTLIDTSLINDLRTLPDIDAYMQQMLPKIELERKLHVTISMIATIALLQSGHRLPVLCGGSKSVIIRPSHQKRSYEEA